MLIVSTLDPSHGKVFSVLGFVYFAFGLFFCLHPCLPHRVSGTLFVGQDGLEFREILLASPARIKACEIMPSFVLF